MATLKQAIEYAKQNPNSIEANQLRAAISSGKMDDVAIKEGIDLTGKSQTFGNRVNEIRSEESDTPGFVRGLGKSAAGLIAGAGELGTKIGSAILDPGLKAVTGQGLQTAPIFTEGSTQNTRLQDALVPQEGEKAGKLVGDIAQFAIPGGQVTRATKGAKLATKIGARALTSGTVATVQEGEIGKEAAIAAGSEIALPLVGKAFGFIGKRAKNILSNSAKRIAAGLGAPVEEIIENPQAFDDAMASLGNADKKELTKVLNQNTRSIIGGVNKIKSEASQAFGEGLEQLGKVDIPVEDIATPARNVANKFGINLGSLADDVDDAFIATDFGSNKQAVNKATKALNRINGQSKFDGKSIRSLLKEIDSLQYKNVQGDPTRQDLNLFLGDLSKTLRDSISKNSDELQRINAQYSKELQLAEVIESTVGKLKFKGNNLVEFKKASDRMKKLFTDSDVGEEVLDTFLNRVGIDPVEMRATESVRRVLTTPIKAESAGFNPFEIVRQVTAGIISPKDATKAATFISKLAQPRQIEILNQLSNVTPDLRASFIGLITSLAGDDE